MKTFIRICFLVVLALTFFPVKAKSAETNIEWSPFAKAYLSRIENLKIKFLKTEQLSQISVCIKWLLPTEKEVKPDYFKLTIYKDGLKTPYIEKNLAKDKKEIILSLYPGKYKAVIVPFVNYPEKKYGRQDSISFMVDKNFKIIGTTIIENILYQAEAKFKKALANTSSQKAKEEVRKWLCGLTVVKKVVVRANTINIKFINGKNIILSLNKITDKICGAGDEDDNMYYFLDDVMNLDIISVDDFRTMIENYLENGILSGYLWNFFRIAPQETTCPYSNKAIVIDTIMDMPEGDDPHEAYRRNGLLWPAVQGLEAMGYQVDIKIDSEANLEMLTQLDEGGYGVIVYAGHGGSNDFENEDGSLREEFIVTTGPKFNSLEEAENSPYAEYAGALIMLTEHKYWILLTKEFIDHYMDDVLFPGTFIYWFACSSGRDFVLDNVYQSLREKGVTTGWLGFEHVNANVSRHAWATQMFFDEIQDPVCTLAEATDNGNARRYPGNINESSLRLIDRDRTGTNKLYIELPDLTIDDVLLDANNNLLPVIRNIGEGTITSPRHVIHVRVRKPGSGYIYDGYAEYNILGPNEELRPNLGVQIPEDCELTVYVDLHGMVESNDENNNFTKIFDVAE